MNTPELRTGFEYKGAIFQTTTDSEIIAYAIAQERLRCPSVEEAVCRAMKGLRGAFSLIVMSPRKLVAARSMGISAAVHGPGGGCRRLCLRNPAR